MRTGRTTVAALLVGAALAQVSPVAVAAPPFGEAGRHAAPSVTSVRLPAWPTARRGDVNQSRVRTVQHLLRARADRRLATAADGVFGPATQRAVQQLQRLAGLRPTGVVDPATWRSLVLPARTGSRGEHVRAVQSLLSTYGRAHPGYAVTVDGVFGPRTAAAVLRFQRAVDITDDGRVGPTTWAFLVDRADRVEAAD